MEVGIRQLRDNLSRYVSKARAGDEIIITERGRRVARLTGVVESPTLDRLIQEGVVRPAERPKRGHHRGRVKPRGSVSELVRDQRR